MRSPDVSNQLLKKQCQLGQKSKKLNHSTSLLTAENFSFFSSDENEEIRVLNRVYYYFVQFQSNDIITSEAK